MVKESKHVIIRRAIFVGLGAFFLALVVSTVANGILDSVTSVWVAVILLLFIIIIGIILDIVGTAVTAADESVFHAMATKRIPGSLEAAYLVRNADRVANTCNDVVGDVSSAISGALGAGLAILITKGTVDSILPETIITGCIAGLTVGGKALGKNYAITQANKIIYLVGLVFAKLGIKTNIKGKRKIK